MMNTETLFRTISGKYTPVIILVIALALAGSAAWVAIGYLDGKEAAIRQEVMSERQRIKVVVAAHDIRVGEIVSPQNMSVRDIPQTYIPDDAVFPEDFGQIQGLELAQPVSSGKPLLRTALKGLSGASTFSELIPIGNRAVTLEVDVLSTNESLIVAGDTIDLAIVGEGDGKGGNNGFQVLLQNVPVMATGPITLSEPPVNLLGYGDKLYRYQSLTISVPEADVSKIYTVKDATFTFLVRNPEDKLIAGYNNSNTSSHIEVVVGGSSENGLLTTTVVSPQTSPAANTAAVAGQSRAGQSRAGQSRAGQSGKVRRSAKYSSTGQRDDRRGGDEPAVLATKD